MAREPDPWSRLRALTPARVALGRSGDAPSLRSVLDFQLAHAHARDAIHTGLDVTAIRRALAPLPSVAVASRAGDRATYLRRPDLGRRLAAESRAELAPGACDLVLVIADGLSATGVQRHAVPLVEALLPLLPGWNVGPVVVASQARVGLGDDIGEALGAKLCAVLIGERPGLSVSDSLGVYVTWGPRVGRRDSERNCISNIHGHGGLGPARAAERLAWLLREARARGLSGVALKDGSGAAALLPPED